ncbi:hypothetical protein IAC76_09745 [Spirochaetes bacterium]|uniref:Uncharacterized protein n=1 Tax=Candidatus Scatousia excrementipullorum TaxID=2840936 RepID=A0A9D9DRM2_9BACT|nr:hypothetical protein [Candidatus Scatousia excrementipullorum]
MMTKTPKNEIIDALKNEELSLDKMPEISMEVPLQKMFDEMLVFISKTDFE